MLICSLYLPGKEDLNANNIGQVAELLLRAVLCCPWRTRLLSLDCKCFKELNLYSQVRMKREVFSDFVSFEYVVKVREQYTEVLISPLLDQEGNKPQRPNSNFCRPLKNNSEGCPSNQVSAAAMTSASDEKWRPLSCFFIWVGLRTYQHPCISCNMLHAFCLGTLCVGKFIV